MRLHCCCGGKWWRWGGYVAIAHAGLSVRSALYSAFVSSPSNRRPLPPSPPTAPTFPMPSPLRRTWCSSIPSTSGHWHTTASRLTCGKSTSASWCVPHSQTTSALIPVPLSSQACHSCVRFVLKQKIWVQVPPCVSHYSHTYQFQVQLHSRETISSTLAQSHGPWFLSQNVD